MSQTNAPNPIDESFENSRRLRGLVETNGAVAWITRQGSENLLYLSPGAEIIFGRPRDELLADPNWRLDAIHPDDLPRVKETILSLSKEPSSRDRKPASGPTQNLRFRILRPDGEARWIEDRISIVPPADAKSTDQEPCLIGGIMNDVTDQVNDENRISEVASAWHSLAETIPFSVLRKDKLGRIVYANQRYCERAERTLDQLLGKTNFDLYSAELARKLTLDDDQMISEGKPIRVIEEHPRRDGSISHFEVFKAPIFNADREITGFLVVFRDITEHKQAEQAFDQERYLLTALLENIPDNIYFKDRESRFIRISNSLAEKFGLDSTADAIGLSDADFFEDENAAYRLQDEQSLINGEAKEVEKVEYEQWSDSGETWLQTTKLPLRDTDGEVIGTFGISRNITKTKLVERDLERERDRLRTIINNVPDIIFVKDRFGRFVNGNTAFLQSLNFNSLDELIGKTDFDIWPAELACNFVADDQIVMRNNTPLVNQEESTRDPVGNDIWLLTSKVPLCDTKGNVMGLVGIGRDITKAKHAKEQLSAAKDAADAANRAESDFLANMSHEIRTPMNAVIGMTELLMDTEVNQNQFDYLKMIKDSGESLLAVINDILDFSKIEAGKLELDPVTFELRESLGDAMKSLAMRAHNKSLELAFRVQKEVPTVLFGDVGRFRQVIVNLVGNAIKFTDKGEVVVDVGVRKSTKETTTLVVKVRDTGIGIPKEVCTKIFDEFQQADSSTTRRYGGTGLGLAISSRLVGLMGGRIGVTSREGLGSEFQFTVAFEARDVKVLPNVPVIVGGTRVLIVDDNETNRLILCEMITNWGMRPTQVESGKKALDELRRADRQNSPYQIVITDVNMLEMDGFLLAQQIRNDDSLKNSSIIMLTSGTRVGDVADRERLNIEISLLKPAKQSELFDAIVRVLGVNTPEDSKQVANGDAIICRPLTILLTEDNIVNQKLAVSVLEKQGHRVEVAHHGREAVEMSSAGQYDLILMDVQMPVMDGLEATCAIREQELNSGGHQIIVAMTAHAMKGDREACLEAGMDEYLSKPIRIQELTDKLSALFGVDQSVADHSQSGSGSKPIQNEDNPQTNRIAEPESANVSAPVISRPRSQVKPSSATKRLVDLERALTNVGNSPELLRDLVAVFLEDLPNLMESLSQAIKHHDARKIKFAAHTLKGSMLFLNTKTPYQYAYKLEQMGEQNELDECEAVFAILRRELATITDELTQFLNEPF